MKSTEKIYFKKSHTQGRGIPESYDSQVQETPEISTVSPHLPRGLTMGFGSEEGKEKRKEILIFAVLKPEKEVFQCLTFYSPSLLGGPKKGTTSSSSSLHSSGRGGGGAGSLWAKQPREDLGIAGEK